MIPQRTTCGLSRSVSGSMVGSWLRFKGSRLTQPNLLLRPVQPGTVLSTDSLGQQLLNYISLYVREAEVASLEPVRQLGMVKPEHLKDGGMQVMHMDPILSHIKAQVITLS